VAGRWTTIFIVSSDKEADQRPAFLDSRYGPSLQRMWDRFRDAAVVAAEVQG